MANVLHLSVSAGGLKNSLFVQKKDTENRTVDIQTINKSPLAYHFKYESC